MNVQRTLLYVFFYSSVFCSSLYAQDVLQSEEHRYTLTEKNDSVIVESENIVSLSYKSARSLSQTRFAVPEGFNRQIKSIKASYNDESINSFGTMAVPSSDVYISDASLRYFEVPAKPKIDDRLSYTYTANHYSVAFFPLHTVPNINEIDTFVLRLQFPEQYTARFEIVTTHPGVQYHIDSTQPGSLSVHFSRLPEYPLRPYYPLDDVHAAILTQIWRKGELITTTTPKKFVEWYLPYLSKIAKVDNATIAQLKPVVEKATTTKDKLCVLYDYVRKNIHYIADEYSINGYVPRPPDVVCQRLYGDCKDRAFLLSTLGKHFGIPVNMVLINTDDDPEFSAVHTLQYNHMINHVTIEGQEIFMDPTSKHCEFGNVPGYEIGKRVLIIDSLNPRTQRIPQPNTKTTIEIDIQGDSSLRAVKAVIRLRNDEARGAKSVLENRSIADNIDRYLQRTINGFVPGMRINHSSLSAHQDSVIVFEAEMNIENLLAQDGSTLIIPANPFFSFNAIGERMRDSLPIYHPSRFTAVVDIRLKRAHKTQAYTSTSGDASFASLSTSVTSEANNILHISYTFNRAERIFSGAMKEQYKKFMSDFAAARAKVYMVEVE